MESYEDIIINMMAQILEELRILNENIEVIRIKTEEQSQYI